MEIWQLGISAAACAAASIFSGIAGGGGGFIMTPLFILLGLSPAQAVSTGKLNALSSTIGALIGMREAHGRISRWRVIPVVLLAFGIGLAAPFAIKSLDGDVYRIIIGVLLLLTVPLLIAKKVGVKKHQPKGWKRWAGYGALTIGLALQGIFSSGMGVLINVTLMGMLGMTAIEASITKRLSQFVLDITIVFGVLFSGLIAWEVVAVCTPIVAMGGYIGGRLAVKKGDKFVMDVLVVLIIISALALVFGN